MGNGAIQIIPPTLFSFPTSTVPITSETTLARFVPTMGYVSGALILRIHSLTLPTSGQSFAIVGQKASRCPDEPQTIFFTTTGETIATASFGITVNMVVTSMNVPISSATRVLLRTIQVASGGAMSAVLSAELVGRAA
jgi:hypothetical protein